MARKRVLVIEDDASIRQGLVDALDIDGYQTLEAATGDQGLDLALHREYDLVLLDLVLPQRDGLDILAELRKSRPTTPVIILTARGEEQDRVRGLKLGADDYVVKPFSIKELLARVAAVLRRSPERPRDVEQIDLPDATADLARGELRFADGTSCVLSERERDILRYLANNAGRAIERDELLSRVWQMNPRGIETRTIDMHIARLREKLRDDPAQPRIIQTVRGKGYMFAQRPQTD
ncbi:MAG: response regulator transcription factor [Phycisphaerae bacterium]|nr:response regulator transcription factor [Phycisphaerae bacterium]